MLVQNREAESAVEWEFCWNEEQSRNTGAAGQNEAAVRTCITPKKLSRKIYCNLEFYSLRCKNVFELSLQEWEFASKPGVRFDVYRVFGAGDPQRARIVVVEDVARALREQRAQLCLAIQDPRYWGCLAGGGGGGYAL